MYSLEIFDDRVKQAEPNFILTDYRPSNHIRFRPDEEKMKITDAGIFTFEIKTMTTAKFLLTSAFFCGYY